MRWVFCLMLFIAVPAAANDSTKLYNPKADAAADIAKLLLIAKKQNKHLLLQIGGNWCTPCYRLNSFLLTDTALKTLLHNNYIVYHLNYSVENKNKAFLKKLGYPQRFGFPVLVVLDADGNRLHTQDSVLLLKANGYEYDKVKVFLKQWSPAALDDLFYND